MSQEEILRENNPNEKKKDLIAVKCPKCQTVFYKKKTETGKKETCPICHEEVVFNIQKNGQNTHSNTTE